MNLPKRRTIRIVIVSGNHLVQLGLQQILETVKAIVQDCKIILLAGFADTQSERVTPLRRE